ncbi:MAG TPA: nuclear transport factor 2 family protein [Burkholderiaceae bacterium]|nr:nuclear transport factor 2 family protein [Burkholderiaceae bacterium]
MKPEPQDRVEAVLQADSARHQAMLDGDVAALDALLADSLVYTHATARVEGKPEYLESVRQGAVRYLLLERSQAHVDIYGDAAVMHGNIRLRVLKNGQTREMTGMFQCVWVLFDSGWRMVAWASAPSAPPKLLQP